MSAEQFGQLSANGFAMTKESNHSMGKTRTKSAILQGALRSLTLRLIRLVSRLPILVFLAGTMIVPSARGQQQFWTKEIAGVYDGRLQCTSAQHETNFKLSLTATGDSTLTGMLTFDAQDDSGTHAVTYSLKGSTAGAAFNVYPVKWKTPEPARHMFMTSSGAYNVNSWFGLVGDLNGQYVNGQWKSSGTISGIEQGIVINPSCTFSAKRSKAESANIDPHNAAQKEGTAGPAQAVLGPNSSGAGRPVTGARTAAGAGTRQVAPQGQTAAISGVYNGTYTCAIGPRTLKLSLLASGNGSLTGVFTFYLPPTSHTQAFSYSLNGTFDAASGKFKLNPVKWETPPPAGYAMVGMDGAFDPGAGQVAGKITYGSCGAFQATRDQAESANGATQPVASPTVDSKAAPAATAAQPPAKAVAAPSPHAGTYLIYCSSWTGPDVYVSDKFEVPAYGSGGKLKILVAFRQFLHEKYSLPIEDGLTPVGCGVEMGVGGAERSITSVEANIEANAKQGKKIVKTGWKYVGTLPPPDLSRH